MDEKDLLERLLGHNQMQKIMEMNHKTEAFGLVLTEEDAQILMERRMESLKEQQRVEFGEGILPKLIFTFCDSPISIVNYVDTLIRLQEIFIYTKMKQWMS